MSVIDDMKKKTPTCNCTDADDKVCGLEMFHFNETWICTNCDMITLEEIQQRKAT